VVLCFRPFGGGQREHVSQPTQANARDSVQVYVSRILLYILFLVHTALVWSHPLGQNIHVATKKETQNQRRRISKVAHISKALIYLEVTHPHSVCYQLPSLTRKVSK